MKQSKKETEEIRFKVRRIYDLMCKLNLYCAFGSGKKENVKVQLENIKNEAEKLLNELNCEN